MKYLHCAKKGLYFAVIAVSIVICLTSIYFSWIKGHPSISWERKIAINEANIFTATTDNEKLKDFAKESGDITQRNFGNQTRNSKSYVGHIEPKSVEYNFKTSDEYFNKDRTIHSIDCRRLLGVNGSGTSANSTSDISLLSDRNHSTTCMELTRGFIHSSLTELEESFPIAYSILMYTYPAQVVTLLRAIYRPQNIYCIHVDQKSAEAVKTAMSNIVRCFDNVFLSSQSIDQSSKCDSTWNDRPLCTDVLTVNVQWGQYTVLEPEIVCLRDLWKKSEKWRYFINLTGQEFPLKTNYELVKILTAYSGANDVEGIIRRRNIDRWAAVGNPPANLLPVKGAIHVVLSRKFVEFVLTNDTAERLLNWSKKVAHPDEVFFNTLNFNPQLQAPGSYGSDNVFLIESKPFLARYKIWEWTGKCSGYYRRAVCIFDVGDLPRLVESKHLFANKFHWQGGSKLTEYCMAEWLYNRTKQEYFGTVNFNDTYYRSLDFVKRKIN